MSHEITKSNKSLNDKNIGDQLVSNGNFHGKTILVVNTGSIKKKFIFQKMKKLGLKVVVLNKEKNWAKPYVDKWILADTFNHGESIQEVGRFMARNESLKIDGVITFWEDDVLLTSRIVDRFDLIGIPFAISQRARNKFFFRDFCKKNELPVPKYRMIKSDSDIKHVVSNFDFPMVIKPVYGSSSAYVIKVNSKKELEKSYSYIRRSVSASIESALSDGLDIMVEEYIDGDEVDIDMLIQNGRIKFCSVSDNSVTKEPFFVETGRSTPSNLPEKDQEDISRMADELLEKLGVQNGCIHLEAKMGSKGPVPIEANLRMGGDEIYSTVKKAWQVDLVENAIKIALGIHIPRIRKPDEPYKYVVSKDFLADDSGIISKLDVDPEIRKKKYVEEIKFFKEIGDTVLVPPQGYEYLGWITVSGDNFLDAQDNLEEATKFINYEVSRFHSTSSIGKTSRKNHFSFSTLKNGISTGGYKIEKIRGMMAENQRSLHIGIACNSYENKSSNLLVENELTAVGLNIEKVLKERGYRVSFFDFNNLPKAFNDLRRSDVDLVFNVCERINNSSLLEPHAASILDALQIPYTGSNPFALGLCIDKIRVKKLLNYHKIPTPKWDYVFKMTDKIREDFDYPLIVKPANADNSIGITNDSVVANREELERELKKILVDIGRPALIEEYIEGDEYDVSILGSEEADLRVLPLSRSLFHKMPKGYWHIYPFAAKWTDDPIYKNIIVQRPPKDISKKLETLISEIALDTYNILDCHDYGRVEIRVDENNNPYVLELNPNPSINIKDCVPSVAKLAGLEYGDFIEEIIRMAIRRYKNRPPYYHLQAGII